MSESDSKTSKKRDIVVKIAQNLFFKHGIRRISVTEICKEAKVSKMTFYRFFQNKDDLAKHILDILIDGMMELIDAIFESKELSFAEKMEKVTAIKIEALKETSNEFFRDLMDDDSEAGRHMLKRRAEALIHIKNIYIDAQKRGEIRQDVSVDFILAIIEHFRGFMRDETMQKIYPNHSDLMQQVSNFYLHGILN